MAISMSSMTPNTRRPTAVAAPTDRHATLAMTMWVRVNVAPSTRTRFHLSLRGAQRRGNLHDLDDAKHTSTSRHCYGDEIATLRSQ